jgi:LruC domain-containing protein
VYDFGDAPSGYGRTIDDNGPRHEVGDLFLGAGVSTETTPRAIDTFDDGISFVTNIAKASSGDGSSIINVTASKAGYINAWIDWDHNQVFSSDEKVLDGYSVSAGSNSIVISVPASASTGATWSRFRLTSSAASEPVGGAVNGEVEDYQITILEASNYTTVCYPSTNDYVTLAYEDKWPQLGDYDFNDVVLRYRSCVSKIGSNVEKFTIEGLLVAVGADYNNAFAVRLEGVSPGLIDTTQTSHVVNSEVMTDSPVESGRSETILTVIPNTAVLGEKPSGCRFFRTETGCDTAHVIPFSLSVTLTTGIDESSAPSGRFDPFIYAVSGFYHGEDVATGSERGWEVHIKNQAPTEAFNTALYGLQTDVSDTALGIYFQTSQGHPFAIEVSSSSWRVPKEQVKINEAYSEFIPFAESNGSSNTTWYNTVDTSKVIAEDN